MGHSRRFAACWSLFVVVRPSKTELVIVVTPTVLDDENGGSFARGYRPSTSAGRRFRLALNHGSIGMSAFNAMGAIAWAVGTPLSNID